MPPRNIFDFLIFKKFEIESESNKKIKITSEGETTLITLTLNNKEEEKMAEFYTNMVDRARYIG